MRYLHSLVFLLGFEMHKKLSHPACVYLRTHGRRFIEGFYGWFLSCGRYIRRLSTIFRASDPKMRGHQLGLNLEKRHFIVKECIVLGQKVSQRGLEVDKAKIKVIKSYPTTVNKGCSLFSMSCKIYRKFINDF